MYFAKNLGKMLLYLYLVHYLILLPLLNADGYIIQHNLNKEIQRTDLRKPVGHLQIGKYSFTRSIYSTLFNMRKRLSGSGKETARLWQFIIESEGF